MALYRWETRIGWVWNATTYVTQAEYDALPSTKLTNNVNYWIYDGTPGKETINKFIKNWVSYLAWWWESKYWDWSDWDVTITEDTILNAWQQYQFNNLTICPWATVSFSWEGGAKIRVSWLFHNMGTIDMTNIDVQPYEYMDRDTMYKIYNTTWDLWIEFWKGWKWWKVYHWYNCCEVTGSRPDWCDATENCWWAWWQWSAAWGAASWNNWGNWWNWYAWCIYGVDVQVIPWWAGGGWWYNWNWWNWWDIWYPTCRWCNGTLYATWWEKCVVWWNWWNWWILWNWWKWWNAMTWIWRFKGGRWGDWYCWWAWWDATPYSEPYWMRCWYNCWIAYVADWWDWWNWYYWGKWWCWFQWTNGINSAGNHFILSWGRWGKWWRWLVPWAWWDWWPWEWVWWEWWEWASYLYSLNLKTNCFCNEWCILSVWAVWWQWGKWANAKCYTWYGTAYLAPGKWGKWWKWGQWWMMQILTNCVLEKGTISVWWWAWWAWWIWWDNCSWCWDKWDDGAVWETWNDGTLYFYQLEW